MKGAILEKGEQGYTYLKKIFRAIHDVQREYNWLITDCECCTVSAGFRERIFQYGDYGWVSGDELTRMIAQEDFQWVWAVLSGFDKRIPLEEVLRFQLPCADMNRGFWTNPIAVQHPLAELEIVPWDCSCVLIISRNDRIVEDFMTGFPLSRDLALYNEQKGVFDESEELSRWLAERAEEGS